MERIWCNMAEGSHPTRFEEQYSTDDVRGVFEQVRGPTIVSSDVTEALGCGDQTARNKLDELHDSGVVKKRKTPVSTLWWLAADEEVSDDE